MTFKKILLFLSIIGSTLCADAEKVTPYEGSRILWDMRSRQHLFDDGWYARMIQLQDGRLLAASESGGKVIISYSDDMGKTWSPQEKIFSPPKGLGYFDVDLCQLSDGKIIITYNIGFPDESAPDGRFGVRLRISEDNGKSWSDDIFVYDGERTFENGTWEPNILELPSGELHLYVSDEAPYTQSAEQCIQLFRSFDKGYTWQGPETVSFRQGARDGMPTALILGDSIVVTIEDNGWPGMESFIPVTVRTPLKNNWKEGPVGGDSEARSRIIDERFCPPMFGGAPYMRMLPSGETILSRQSYLRSGEYALMNMFAYVGDEEGRNFKAMTLPFGDNLDSRISIEVNSLTVVGDSMVYALGGFMSGGVDNRRHVDIVAGYPMKQATAYRGKPTIDGIKHPGEYGTPAANQIKMGTNSLSRNVYADFSYDNDYLYFVAEVDDETPSTLSANSRENEGFCKDGVTLLIDADNVSDDTPVKGVYEFFFPAGSEAESRRGEKGSWIPYNTKGIRYKSVRDGEHYVVEAAVPWRLLGKKRAPRDQRLAVAVEVTDRRGETVITETLPDARHNESWTWLPLRLSK